MPTYPILNRDAFNPGGVMDAPDLGTRMAALRAQQGQALAPEDVQRLAVRQGLEQANGAAAQPALTGGALAMALRPSTGGYTAPGHGGIDVNSYTGSMYNGTAQPRAGYQPAPTFEAAADKILSARNVTPSTGSGPAGPVGTASAQPALTGGALAMALQPGGAPGAMPSPQASAQPALDPRSLATLLQGSRLDTAMMSAPGEEHAQRQRLLTLQGDEAQRRQDQDAANLTAARGAIGTEGDEATGAEVLRRYLAAGGDGTGGMGQLVAAAAKPPKEKRELQTITLKDDEGKPVTFAWDGASAPQRISKERLPEKPQSGAGKLLEDAARLEASGDVENGKMLRAIAAKQAEDKPLDPIAYAMTGGKLEDYASYAAAFKKASASLKEKPGTAEKPAATAPAAKAPAAPAAAPAAAGAAPLISSQAEFDQLAKGAKFKLPDGRTGVKK